MSIITPEKIVIEPEPAISAVTEVNTANNTERNTVDLDESHNHGINNQIDKQ